MDMDRAELAVPERKPKRKSLDSEPPPSPVPFGLPTACAQPVPLIGQMPMAFAVPFPPRP